MARDVGRRHRPQDLPRAPATSELESELQPPGIERCGIAAYEITRSAVQTELTRKIPGEQEVEGLVAQVHPRHGTAQGELVTEVRAGVIEAGKTRERAATPTQEQADQVVLGHQIVVGPSVEDRGHESETADLPLQGGRPSPAVEGKILADGAHDGP